MFSKILESEKILELHQALQAGDSALVEDLWNASKALVASLAQQATGKHILILTGGSQEEARLYHDFAFYSGCPVVDFPAWETLPSEHIPPSPDIVGERYHVLRNILASSQPYIVLTSLQAALQKLIPPKLFQDLYLLLQKGSLFPFEKLIARLVEMGYQKRPTASDKGEFAVRGGIIDIFPVSSPDPYRLEYWGDDIESIRIFDPIGQRSVKPVEQIEITPANEFEFVQKGTHLSTLLDYLGPNTVVIFDDLLALEDRYAALVNICGTPSGPFSNIDAFLDAVAPLQKMYWSQQPIEELSSVRMLEKSQAGYYSALAPMQKLTFQMFNRDLIAKKWSSPFLTVAEYLFPEESTDIPKSSHDIINAIGKLHQSDVDLRFLCQSELDDANLHKKIQDAGIALPKQTSFQLAYLSSGLIINDLNLIFLPTAELTQRYKIRRQKQRSTYHTSPSEVYQLTPGEMVVHYNNGIGRYLGLEKRPNHQGILSEFFMIEYAENAKLYVPINQAHLISKYIGSDEVIPQMHSLGSLKWKRAKESTERAVLAYAADLLELYARREIKGGFAFKEDSPDLLAFEEDFPFIETEDQLSAIAVIKEDMRSPKSMDRLVCGDVGYGKTEVAMRAAFKAVADGQKQVAVLVPTTVLAMQHYENFVDRFANFPINIAVLSRFQTQKETREALKGIAAGSVDILIGTHRIISDDIVFNDLGLIIIDEEQRFGVKAKEHLKKIKVGVDCLTLSATPIPRTLYMSLISARDMSVINTPPQDRLPITTIVTEGNDLTLKNALLRELARDGQAYVIHNRVESIYDFASRIKKLLPLSRVVVAHGQMHSDEIDTVFHAFKSGHADILVATTIVENGIDIPNANTILIDRADRFGMADLYQLRGRVGRWNRRAYAYFLVPSQRSLPEIVRKRLSALAESSGYGGGMKVAMRDLELRGAGNILGIEQSGHVSAIGFHLYCKLLKRAIQSLQGKIPSIITDTKMEFTIDARLPEEYVNETSMRMEIYQKLGEAICFADVDIVLEELKDRFGIPPEPVLWLYHLTRLRVFASQHGFTLLKQDKVTITAEKQKGKESTAKKFLMPKPKTPKQMEVQIIHALCKEFGIIA